MMLLASREMLSSLEGSHFEYGRDAWCAICMTDLHESRLYIEEVAHNGLTRSGPVFGVCRTDLVDLICKSALGTLRSASVLVGHSR